MIENDILQVSNEGQNDVFTTSLGSQFTLNQETGTSRRYNNMWTIGYGASFRKKVSGQWGPWKHTYTEWGFIVTNNDIVAPPEIETHYVEIPGTSTILDLSEYVTGQVGYKQRKLNFSLQSVCDPDLFLSKYSDFLNYIHGNRIQIKLDGDPDWYYEGRATVDKPNRVSSIMSVDLEVLCDPYKYSLVTSGNTSL